MQDSAYSSFNNNESDTSLIKQGKEKSKIYKLILRKKKLTENSPEISNISKENSENILLCNLCQNNLTTLPENLKSLQNLISLDLRKNNFKDINEIIEFVSQYKYLSDLKLDFSNSSQVQTLLNKIPNLLYINGKSTEEYITAVDVNKEYVDEISIEKKLSYFSQRFPLIHKFTKNDWDLCFPKYSYPKQN